MKKTFEIDVNTLVKSDSYGEVSLADAAIIIKNYIENNKNCKFEIAIGTDSMTYSESKLQVSHCLYKVYWNSCRV